MIAAASNVLIEMRLLLEMRLCMFPSPGIAAPGIRAVG
jgi:hypothetical protein